MRQVWLATDDVAAALCDVPLVRPHAHALATWRQINPDDHVRQVLHDDMFNSSWEQHPLLMGLFFSDSQGAEAMTVTKEGESWMRGAVQIAIAFGRIVEWLRSRLSGYPNLLVPQLTSRSVRCQPSGFFFGPGLPWLRTFRSERPQFQNRVDVRPLEAGREQAERIREATATLASALAEADEFREFADAQAQLDDPMQLELRALRGIYREETAEDRLSAVEPELMMRRHQFQQAVMEEVLERATEPSRRYLAAFGRVDELISAVGRVMEELVVFGPPPQIGAVTEGVWRSGRFGHRVRLRVDGDANFMGAIRMVEVTAEVDDLAGAVLTDALNVSWSADDAIAITLSGEQLPGSAGALTSGPAR